MKKYLITALLLSAAVCFGQNVRYSAPFPSISNVFPYYLTANVPPNSPVLAVCSSPANALPCTNYATTYTSLGVACHNGAQDTPDPNPSACQSTGDSVGNIAFWIPAGTYDYTVCISNNCFGPYTITIGISGGGSGTVTNVSTTLPITGGPITTTGGVACPTCVTSTSPGVGIAHFAGSTQNVTSSAVDLSDSDVINNLGVSHLNGGTGATSSTFWRGDGTWAAAAGITGSGTSQTIPLWSSTSAIGNSLITQTSAGGTGYQFGSSGTQLSNVLPFTIWNTFSNSCAGSQAIPLEPNSSSTPCVSVNINSSTTTSNSTGTTLGFGVNHASQEGLVMSGGFTAIGNGTATVEVRAVEADAYGNSTNLSTVRAFVGAPIYEAGGTLPTSQGYYARLFSNGSSTISNNYNFYADSPSLSGGTLTHNYGVYIADQTVGANNLDPWGIFEAGTAKNQLGGALTVPNLTDSALTPGNCVQAGTAGILTTTGSACGAVAFSALIDSATVTWALASASYANNTLTFTTHGGSRTLNITNPVSGGQYTLKLVQDATGGEGLTLGTGCTWKVSGGGGGAITPTSSANAVDVLTFIFDGTNCLANFSKNFS